MKQKILGFLGAVLIGLGCLGAFGVVSEPVYAADKEFTPANDGKCDKTLLGFRAWYYTSDGSLFKVCRNGEVQMPDSGDEDVIVKFVWTVILNVSFDLTLAIGYIAVAMVIYGGYMYIMAQGDPSKAAKGQHTLVSATIGVVIAMGASVIVNTAQVILGLGGGGTPLGDDAAVRSAVSNILTWAYTMAGLVAVVFIIKGGVEYVISRGDPGRVQKATKSLIYAVIGLIIVLMAALITAAVMRAIGGAL